VDSLCKADLTEELSHYNGIDYASSGISRSDYPKCQTSPFCKVGATESHNWHKEDASSDSGANALSEQELPVGLGHAHCEDADQLEDHAYHDGGAEVSGIQCTPGKHAQAEEETGLSTPNP
jgi:hypothetical protein